MAIGSGILGVDVGAEEGRQFQAMEQYLASKEGRTCFVLFNS